MFRIILYFLGIIFTSLGILFTVIYSNLITMGYSFLDFVHFITRKLEFYYLIIGIILISLSLERWNKK